MYPKRVRSPFSFSTSRRYTMPDGEDNKAAEAAKAKAEADAKANEQQKTYPEAYVKQLIAERDKAKDKARKVEEAEKKALEAKAIEEGKIKEVLAQRESEIAAAREKLTKYEEMETKRREGLISQLPDDKKELYSSVGTDVLEDLVNTLTKRDSTKGTGPGRTNPAMPDSYGEALLDSKKMAELMKHPDIHAKMSREWSSKR
jgi:membrane protein involved in colicin uptake